MTINRNSKRKWLAVLTILAMLMSLLPGSVFAAPQLVQVVVPIPGPALNINQVTVNDGPGGQTDPHVSGDWVSYTDNSVFGIRFRNLDLGAVSEQLIPHADGFYDLYSDISGNNVVFARTTVASYQGIYLVQTDIHGNPGLAIEVSPPAISSRVHTALGGDTIAYEDRSYGGSSTAPSEISLSSALNPSAPAQRLTNDIVDDQWPAVGLDGRVVVWLKCSSPSVCDVWRAEQTAGVWGAPEQVTGGEGNESLPDTNGPVTVYGSNAGGDDNIRWSVKDDRETYVEYVLDLPGIQRNSNISGHFITFESNTTPGSQFDNYLYDLTTNRLYRLTDTPFNEMFSDVSTGPGGLVRVVWAQPKQVYPYDMDIYAMSFLVDITAPVIMSNVQGTLGQSGWYTSDVTLDWTASDNESDFTSTGCDPVTITSDQAATDYTCSADSAGGTSSSSVNIARNATKPVTTVTGVSEGASYDLGSVPQAGCSSTDNLSGVATEATLTLTGGDAQGTGNFTATCSGALDAAGNAANPAVVHYTVSSPSNTYNFTGFFQPVDNPGEGPSYVFNSVKAGSAIPVKFSLGGNQGLSIFSPGSPLSKPANCTTAAISDPIEQTVEAGNSSLSYDAANAIYTYVWKTDKNWAGTCRVLIVGLADGTPHLAYFQFK